MTDREKVIKGLECCISFDSVDQTCMACPFENDCVEKQRNTQLLHDALALLKEKPEIIQCKDCKIGKESCGNIQCHKPGMREYESDLHSFYWFCADGEHE